MRLILTFVASAAACVLVPYVLRKFPGPELGLQADPYRHHPARLALMVVPIPVAILAAGVLAGAGGPGRASWPTVLTLSAAACVWTSLLWLTSSVRPRYLLLDSDGSPQVTFVRWRRILLAGLGPVLIVSVAGLQWVRGQWGRQESVLIIAASIIIGGFVYRSLRYRVAVTPRGLKEAGGFFRARTVEWGSVDGLNEVEQMGSRLFLLPVRGGKAISLWTRRDGFPAFAAALLDHLHECGTVLPRTRQALEVYARLVPRSTAPDETNPNES